MTPDEIKTRCRKAYLITQNNHIFDIDHPNNVSVCLYHDKKYAQKMTDDLKRNAETSEYHKRLRGRKIELCEVYIVPAKKID